MSTAVVARRLAAEIRDLSRPNFNISARPVTEGDMFDWHFTLRGPPQSEFSNGIYHGRIQLPSTYPMAPPTISFITPTGRFEVNTKVCLSISSHHPESWTPQWNIRLMLNALQSFLTTKPEGAVGSLDYPVELREKLANESSAYVCPVCGPIKNLLAPEDEPTNEVITPRSDVLVTSTKSAEPANEPQDNLPQDNALSSSSSSSSPSSSSSSSLILLSSSAASSSSRSSSSQTSSLSALHHHQHFESQESSSALRVTRSPSSLSTSLSSSPTSLAPPASENTVQDPDIRHRLHSRVQPADMQSAQTLSRPPQREIRQNIAPPVRFSPPPPSFLERFLSFTLMCLMVFMSILFIRSLFMRA